MSSVNSSLMFSVEKTFSAVSELVVKVIVGLFWFSGWLSDWFSVWFLVWPSAISMSFAKPAPPSAEIFLKFWNGLRLTKPLLAMMRGVSLSNSGRISFAAELGAVKMLRSDPLVASCKETSGYLYGS